jgi:hypothetical protein
MRFGIGRKGPWLRIGVAAVAAVAATGAFGASDASTGAAASAASARCSKAEATAILKRLRLGYADLLPNPVGGVLRGRHGPNSRTMFVVLRSGGASAPVAGWTVFRLAGGAWQLVMERKSGNWVAPAGPDIR